ncbi:MAG TPA: tRNA (adenosine(37)-N6)-threonylcarbamoyltransferase complex ATPase subunit type 1 TsaE [Candidatus Hydrogenedentes bacterium]|nr:tRNA (adenosine(37)-N6)-threonylcarbamoyltransferase complex ATPase subunit type 1 TsaE [Candidatus Hydrogenedentota bacterium]
MNASTPEIPRSPGEHARIIETNSPEQTEQIGAWLAHVLPDGCVVALFGDLAAGKTCLTRGMASVFGAKAIHSPTFTLENRYGTPPRQLIHLDLYRLPGPHALTDLGWEESFEPETGLCVIEWADRAMDWLPPLRVDVRIYHAGNNRRRVEIEPVHPDITLPEFPVFSDMA